MNKSDILQKMIQGVELSKEEKIEASVGLVPKNEILPLNEISPDERIEIARNLISQKVADILQDQMIVSRLSGRGVDITLSSKDCIDSDESIKKFLAILGANNIKVTSDFPAYCETFEGRTFVKFKF